MIKNNIASLEELAEMLKAPKDPVSVDDDIPEAAESELV